MFFKINKKYFTEYLRDVLTRRQCEMQFLALLVESNIK